MCRSRMEEENMLWWPYVQKDKMMIIHKKQNSQKENCSIFQSQWCIFTHTQKSYFVCTLLFYDFFITATLRPSTVRHSSFTTDNTKSRRLFLYFDKYLSISKIKRPCYLILKSVQYAGLAPANLVHFKIPALVKYERTLSGTYDGFT